MGRLFVNGLIVGLLWCGLIRLLCSGWVGMGRMIVIR